MCQLLIQMVHNSPKLRLSKLRIVVYPSSDLRVYLLDYLIHMPLPSAVQFPRLHRLVYLLHRLLADGRGECREHLTRTAVPCLSWPECVAEKVERVLMTITTLAAVAVLAVDYLRLFRIQRQFAIEETLHNHFFHILRLLFGLDMADGVVRIPLKRYLGVVDFHPPVKHIVQEQVGQHRPYH